MTWSGCDGTATPVVKLKVRSGKQAGLNPALDDEIWQQSEYAIITKAELVSLDFGGSVVDGDAGDEGGKTSESTIGATQAELTKLVNTIDCTRVKSMYVDGVK